MLNVINTRDAGNRYLLAIKYVFDSSEEIIISVCSSSGLELAYKNYPDCHIIFFPFELELVQKYEIP